MLDKLKNFATVWLYRESRRDRSEANYMLAQVLKHKGETGEAIRLLREAVNIMPDNLGPRFELRRDVPDPLEE